MDIYMLIVALFSVAALFTKKNKLGSWIFLLFATLHLLLIPVFIFYISPLMQGNEVMRDCYKLIPLSFTYNGNRMLMFWVEAVIVFFVALYNLNFVKRKEELHYHHNQHLYHASVIGFIGAMDMAIFSNNLGMVWVFIELSTLLSVFLIAYHNSKNALEASWKYVFICSIGIALAMAGIVFISIATNGDLNFSSMQISNDKIFAAKIALVFLIVGFGTKVGLAPVHNWLPDAHSEAPAPISALLSATLLNSAFVAIISIVDLCKGIEELYQFANNLLLIMGFLSLLFAAALIQKVDNFKRMLAYSSIENMGIIAIAFALQSTAMGMHVIGHSLIKAALFLCAGNILTIYGTKEIANVRGLLKRNPTTGYIWLFGILAILGSMPFLLFLSEFILLFDLFSYNMILGIIFALLLTMIIYGMGHNMLAMLRIEDHQELEDYERVSLGALAHLPSIFMLSIACICTIILLATFAGKAL